MSKTGQWVFEMQEDAAEMSKPEFIQKHGIMADWFYDDYHTEQFEPDFAEMDDGA